MGAINYMTSDYITLGIKPIDYYDVEHDPELMEELQNLADMNDCNIDQAIADYVYVYYDDCFSNVEFELSRCDFAFFSVTVEPGYYEGFCLNISFDQLYFDCYDDKREAQKEITRIKELLLKCAGYGLVQCFPGWCTGYKRYDETIKGINAAVVAMREDVKNTPTCSQYWRSCI